MGARSRPQRYCQALAPRHVAQRSGAQLQSQSGVPQGTYYLILLGKPVLETVAWS